MNLVRRHYAGFAMILAMKPYIKKPSAPEPANTQAQDPQPEAAEDAVELPELELEDPVQKNVDGFDPYNTGIFRIDQGPWNKSNGR